MRPVLFAVVVLLGLASRAGAQSANDQNSTSRWKPIDVPIIDPNFGLTARLGANQSDFWQSEDSSNLARGQRSWDNDRTFGLKISKPLQF